MSEAMNVLNCRDFRCRLMTTVSMLAFFGFVAGASQARASGDDADRPVLWIDLGGQFERTDRGQDLPAPPFDGAVQPPLPSPVTVNRPPLHSYGAEAGISFEPEESGWVFSASLRYGRSNGKKDFDDQLEHRALKYVPHRRDGYYTSPANILDIVNTHRESHAIADFQAGKDVGMGLFGGTSALDVGVRFAQFESSATTNINAKPDTVFYNGVPKGAPASWYIPLAHYHVYKFSADAHSSFRGIGPSIVWNASQPFLHGGAQFDWGMNAAVLFGRQKALIHQKSSTGFVQQKYYPNKYKQISHHTFDHIRDRAVTVPNLGGFAGLSFRYANAKISFGYRGDFFFGALDTGDATRKPQTVGFYGPFATISVGIGG
jgi:hypothetical protein